MKTSALPFDLVRMRPWLIYGAILGVVLAVLVFSRDDPSEQVSPKVRTIVDGLRETSVYEDKDAPGYVDAQRAREVIGDRPIVVAILDKKPLPKGEPLRNPRQKLCGEIADVVDTNIVILFAADDRGMYGSAFCTGPNFRNAKNPVRKGYDFTLIAVAELGWKYRVTPFEMTAKIEEYVLAFDAQIVEEKMQFIPRRAVIQPPPPEPDRAQATQIVLSIGGIIFGTVAVFVGVHLVAMLLQRRQGKQAETDREWAELNARLSKIGDEVLHARRPATAAEAEHQAELAERYLLTMHEFDRAATPAEAERAVAELERTVHP